MILYISGRYSGKISQNIAAARNVAIKLWEAGHTVICPHLNTQHFEKDCKLEYRQYIDGDMKILVRCDAIIMLPDWKKSKGACCEIVHAQTHGIPVYYWPDFPPVHPVEIARPLQCEEFINTTMKMYRMHLNKNADYSPANILGTGEIGLITRLWDKVARLMNLTGFEIDARLIRHRIMLFPKNESIDDTLIDTANYSIIGLILRKQLWGK